LAQPPALSAVAERGGTGWAARGRPTSLSVRSGCGANIPVNSKHRRDEASASVGQRQPARLEQMAEQEKPSYRKPVREVVRAWLALGIAEKSRQAQGPGVPRLARSARG